MPKVFGPPYRTAAISKVRYFGTVALRYGGPEYAEKPTSSQQKTKTISHKRQGPLCGSYLSFCDVFSRQGLNPIVYRPDFFNSVNEQGYFCVGQKRTYLVKPRKCCRFFCVKNRCHLPTLKPLESYKIEAHGNR